MAEKQTARSKQVCQYTNLVNILTVHLRHIWLPDITVGLDAFLAGLTTLRHRRAVGLAGAKAGAREAIAADSDNPG